MSSISPHQNRATSASEVKNILQSKGVKLNSVIVKDQISDLIKNPKSGFYLLNYGTWFEGTHWAVIHVIDKNNFEFFSSFGDPPLLEIAKARSIDTVYNNLKIQSNLSDNCGLYCVAFILWRNSKRSFDSFIKQFEAVDSEKKLLENDKKMIGIINAF